MIIVECIHFFVISCFSLASKKRFDHGFRSTNATVGLWSMANIDVEPVAQLDDSQRETLIRFKFDHAVP
jgi:hypothetical protein